MVAAAASVPAVEHFFLLVAGAGAAVSLSVFWREKDGSRAACRAACAFHFSSAVVMFTCHCIIKYMHCREAKELAPTPTLLREANQA